VLVVGRTGLARCRRLGATALTVVGAAALLTAAGSVAPSPSELAVVSCCTSTPAVARGIEVVALPSMRASRYRVVPAIPRFLPVGLCPERGL